MLLILWGQYEKALDELELCAPPLIYPFSSLLCTQGTSLRHHIRTTPCFTFMRVCCVFTSPNLFKPVRGTPILEHLVMRNIISSEQSTSIQIILSQQRGLRRYFFSQVCSGLAYLRSSSCLDTDAYTFAGSDGIACI